jgi:hypothetical protein
MQNSFAFKKLSLLHCLSGKQVWLTLAIIYKSFVVTQL